MDKNKKPPYKEIMAFLVALDKEDAMMSQSAEQCIDKSLRLAISCLQRQVIINKCQKALCIYWAEMILKEEKKDYEEVASCIEELDAIAGVLDVPIQECWYEKFENEEIVADWLQMKAEWNTTIERLIEEANFWADRQMDNNKNITDLNSTYLPLQNGEKDVSGKQKKTNIFDDEITQKKQKVVKKIRDLFMKCKEIDKKSVERENSNNNSNNNETSYGKEYDNYYNMVYQQIEQSILGVNHLGMESNNSGQDIIENDSKALMIRFELNARHIEKKIKEEVCAYGLLKENRLRFIALIKDDIKSILEKHTKLIKEWEQIYILRGRLKLLFSKEFTLNKAEKRLIL